MKAKALARLASSTATTSVERRGTTWLARTTIRDRVGLLAAYQAA